MPHGLAIGCFPTSPSCGTTGQRDRTLGAPPRRPRLRGLSSLIVVVATEGSISSPHTILVNPCRPPELPTLRTGGHWCIAGVRVRTSIGSRKGPRGRRGERAE